MDKVEKVLRLLKIIKAVKDNMIYKTAPLGTIHTYSDGKKYQKKMVGNYSRWVPVDSNMGDKVNDWDIDSHYRKNVEEAEKNKKEIENKNIKGKTDIEKEKTRRNELKNNPLKLNGEIKNYAKLLNLDKYNISPKNYDTIGLRIMDKKRKYKIGENIEDTSKDLSDYDPIYSPKNYKPKNLSGLSALSYKQLIYSKTKNEPQKYDGDSILILQSEDNYNGDDPFEIVMKNPKIIDIIPREKLYKD